LRIGAAGIALVLALCLSTPFLFAQAPEASSDSVQAGSPEALQSAQSQGPAEKAALDWILANSGPLKGDYSGGGFRVAYTVTPAEGWWDKAAGGSLLWRDAPPNSFHLRIFVMDSGDGRLQPDLRLHVTLIDANGNRQVAPIDFGWYPLLNAYGGNVPLAADGAYSVRIVIDSQLPAPPEHSGERTRTTVVEFPALAISQEAISHLALASYVASTQEAELLKPLNAALSAAITGLWQRSASGLEKPAGDYFVGYALDHSGAALSVGGAKLRLKNLVEFGGKDDVRLTLLVRDSRTGRPIPGLRPQASLAGGGKLYGPGDLTFVWHPLLARYAGDTRVPGKGPYSLSVHFEAPGFRRWGRTSERFALPADVTFDELSLKAAK
jgi:hypothetical protein